MNIEIKVPMLPESVTDGTLGEWQKNKGDLVKADDVLVALETDKVAMDIPAGYEGVLSKILIEAGTIVKSGEVLATINTDKEAIMNATKSSTKSSSAASTPVAAEKSTKPMLDDTTQNLAGPAARRKRSIEPEAPMANAQATEKSTSQWDTLPKPSTTTKSAIPAHACYAQKFKFIFQVPN